jgi:outer membrane protein assembly factor BamB
MCLRIWLRIRKLVNRFVTSACAADGVVYAGTRGFGIFAFPVGGGEARKIDSRAGLPSDQVSSIAALGGKLYAGFEGGYVACLDADHQRRGIGSTLLALAQAVA